MWTTCQIRAFKLPDQSRLIAHHISTSTPPASSKTSSRSWLQRHLKDPYVKKARALGYRARSAFKLLEIDDRFKLLRPGMAAVECGGAPGAWTQILTDRLGPKGVVVSCDLLHFEPVPGAHIVTGDFTKPETQAAIDGLLGGRRPDLVVSDMAPNASGDSRQDHDAIVGLAYAALRFALLHSRPKTGCFLCKLWDGHSTKQFTHDLTKFYGNVETVKPKSSRKDSAEIFVLAMHFKGVQQNSSSSK